MAWATRLNIPKGRDKALEYYAAIGMFPFGHGMYLMMMSIVKILSY